MDRPVSKKPNLFSTHVPFVSHTPPMQCEYLIFSVRGGDKIQILNRKQISALLDAVTEQKYHVLFFLALFSSARQRELLGLKWSDIQWSDSQLHIQRTFNDQQFYDTETKESNRKIDIGPAALKRLKEWRIACPPGDLYLVFPTKNGNPMNHNNMVSRYFLPGLTTLAVFVFKKHKKTGHKNQKGLEKIL